MGMKTINPITSVTQASAAGSSASRSAASSSAQSPTRTRFGSVRSAAARPGHRSSSTAEAEQVSRRPGHAPVADATGRLQLFDPLRSVPSSGREAASTEVPGEWLPPLTPPVVSQTGSRRGAHRTRRGAAVPPMPAARALELRPATRQATRVRSMRLTLRGQLLMVIVAGLAVAGISLGVNLGGQPAATAPAVTVQVLDGDTAASIAARVATPGDRAAVEAAIIAANGLDVPGATLRPGEIVLVPAR